MRYENDSVKWCHENRSTRKKTEAPLSPGVLTASNSIDAKIKRMRESPLDTY